MDDTALPYRDRRTGLILFGALELVVGGLALLLTPLVILGQAVAAKAGGAAMDPRLMIPGVAVYGLIGAVFITLGVGSILARRWARALTLVVAWSWLVVGVVTMAFEAYLLPRILLGAATEGPAMPAGVAAVAMGVTFALLALFLVALPGALVLFYRSPHVRATVEARDPVSRWTDRCPLPLLAVSLWLWLGGLSMLTLPVSGMNVLPVFGGLLTGWAAGVCCVVLGLGWLWLGWALYRRAAWAWWVLVGCLVVLSISTVVTFLRVDFLEVYRLMGYPEQQIELMRRFSGMIQPAMTIGMPVSTAAMLGYLIWVKRFLNPTTSDAYDQERSQGA